MSDNQTAHSQMLALVRNLTDAVGIMTRDMVAARLAGDDRTRAALTVAIPHTNRLKDELRWAMGSPYVTSAINRAVAGMPVGDGTASAQLTNEAGDDLADVNHTDPNAGRAA